MYVNMVANVVCDSLCYRSHGEGEDPWSVHQQSLWGGGKTQEVISLLGRNTLQRQILRTMRTFLKNQIQHSLWDPTSLYLEAIGETLKDW